MAKLDKSTCTVYLIEDDSSQRESLKALLHAEGYRTIGFGSIEEFMQNYAPTRVPGCILLDFIFEDGDCDGLSFLRMHRERIDAMPAVVLTGHADVPVAVDFMKAGAAALLLKPYKSVDLFSSIDQAIEWDVRTLPSRARAEHVRQCMSSMTERQKVILTSVLAGAANKVIASQLNLSERTIELERAEILRTFDVKNAIELAVLITESRSAIDPFHIHIDSPHSTSQIPHFDRQNEVTDLSGSPKLPTMHDLLKRSGS